MPPRWDGYKFILDDRCTDVLEYSENFAGWSDDLTALHEESAGDNHPIDLASRNDAVAQVRDCARSSQAVIVEIGCSSGFLIRDLVKFFPDATIVGADVVRAPLFRLAKSQPGIPLIRFDLLRCPLPDRCVDVLVMLNVLEHIEDDRAALKKAFGLLKPGGSLILEVPAGRCLYDAYDAELNHFRRYSSVELERKLKEAGFIVGRKSHLGFVLFPAFAIIKLFNKFKYFRKTKAVVRQQAAGTSGSGLVQWAMRLEQSCWSRRCLPFGIRVLMTGHRPA